MSTETKAKTPLAVALHYDRTGAPRVVAKGKGEIGKKIIEVAKEHDIPIEENEVLAGALSNVELGDEIPAELYKAVAEVLVFVLRLTKRVTDVPTAIIVQFVSTFGVWIVADRIGLSGVLTMVSYAMSVARTAPERTPARMRIPSYAVWETAVFLLNVLAFVFIGLQIRPILEGLEPAVRGRYFGVAAAVLFTTIGVRIVWHMSFNTVIRWRERRFGFRPPRPMLRPTVGSGLVISWSGMRSSRNFAPPRPVMVIMPSVGL